MNSRTWSGVALASGRMSALAASSSWNSSYSGKYSSSGELLGDFVGLETSWDAISTWLVMGGKVEAVVTTELLFYQHRFARATGPSWTTTRRRAKYDAATKGLGTAAPTHVTALSLSFCGDENPSGLPPFALGDVAVLQTSRPDAVALSFS